MHYRSPKCSEISHSHCIHPTADDMRYAVFMAGHTTPALEAEHGNYGDMAINLLRGGDSEEWIQFPVCDGEFPQEEELRDFQASIVSLQGLTRTLHQ